MSKTALSAPVTETAMPQQQPDPVVAALAARDAAIEDLTARLHSAEAELPALRQALATARREADAAIARAHALEAATQELSGDIDTPDAKTRLQQAVEHDRELRISSFLARDRLMTETLSIQVSDARRRSALRRDLELQSRKLNDLYRSTSWRISAPVRWIGRLLGR